MAHHHQYNNRNTHQGGDGVDGQGQPLRDHIAEQQHAAARQGRSGNQGAVIGYESISPAFAWLCLIGYAMQLYFDFYGYSLMAVGLGKMMGYHLPMNFEDPYASKTVSEFYRRWHVTLGAWFREYLYIPLGGNRKGRLRTYVNLFIVWSLTGLWHGAAVNFILWGIYFFIILVLEKAFLLRLLP